MDALCWIFAVLILHSFDAGNDISAANNNAATCDRVYKSEQYGWVADCSGKDYSKVPRVVVPADETIKTGMKIILYLNRNNFAVLGPDSFVDVIDQRVAIWRLNLWSCHIESIDKDAFKGLEHKLEMLVLFRNKLAEVPTNAITPLKSLRVLALNGNPIERIRENAFSNLTSLSMLDLSECNISRVEKNAFGSLDKLETVLLYKNMIKTLRWEDFERLGSLKYFFVWGNPIEFNHYSVYYNFNGDDDNGEIYSYSMTVRVNEIIYMGELNCDYNSVGTEHYVMHSKMYLMSNTSDSNFLPSSIKAPSFYSRSDVKNFIISMSEFSCGYRRYTCERKGKIIFQDEQDKLLADFGTSIVCNRIRIIDYFNWNVDCAKRNYISVPAIVSPKRSFHYSKKISIDLSSNDFSVLRENSFVNVAKQNATIWKLNLAQCNIHTIEEGAFNSLANLQTLILDGNYLKMLSADIFDRFVQLSEIRIRRLVLIEFQGFSRLNDCNCVENDVNEKKDYGEVSIECETLIEYAPADPNYSIKKRLFTNEFVHDHDHFYCEKTDIDSKSSVEKFKIINRTFSRDICLLYQKREKVDDDYRDNQNLEIDCGNGDYSSIPSIVFPVTLSPSSTFSSWVVNVSVNLSRNNFDRLPANVFFERIHIPKRFSIVTLNLTSCKIITIEKNAFKSLESLVYLRLDGNGIQTISFDVFDRLERLVSIDLRRNPLDIDLCWWKIQKSHGFDSLQNDYVFNVGTEIVLRDCECLKNEDVHGFQLHITCKTFMKDLIFPSSSTGSANSFETNETRPGNNGIKIASDVTVLMNQFTCNFHNFECKIIEQNYGRTSFQLVPTENQLKKPEAPRAFKLTVIDEL